MDAVKMAQGINVGAEMPDSVSAERVVFSQQTQLLQTQQVKEKLLQIQTQLAKLRESQYNQQPLLRRHKKDALPAPALFNMPQAVLKPETSVTASPLQQQTDGEKLLSLSRPAAEDIAAPKSTANVITSRNVSQSQAEKPTIERQPIQQITPEDRQAIATGSAPQLRPEFELKDRVTPLQPSQKDRVTPLQPSQKDRVTPLQPSQKDRVTLLQPSQKDRVTPLQASQVAAGANLSRHDSIQVPNNNQMSGQSAEYIIPTAKNSQESGPDDGETIDKRPATEPQGAIITQTMPADTPKLMQQPECASFSHPAMSQPQPKMPVAQEKNMLHYRFSGWQIPAEVKVTLGDARSVAGTLVMHPSNPQLQQTLQENLHLLVREHVQVRDSTDDPSQQHRRVTWPMEDEE